MNLISRCYDIARVGKFVGKYNTQEEAFEAAAEFNNQYLGILFNLI
jgi:hypothetical protein